MSSRVTELVIAGYWDTHRNHVLCPSCADRFGGSWPFECDEEEAREIKCFMCDEFLLVDEEV